MDRLAEHRLITDTRPVADLIPDPNNARTHPAKQVKRLAVSMRQFGFTNPILVDESGGIIAGHGRRLAAIEAGIDVVSVIVLDGLTEAQKRALRIADNQLALNAGWNRDMLAEELRVITRSDVDLDALGFDRSMLDRLMEIDPDKTPAPPPVPVTQPGDIWQLGAHRLICGDCTDPSVVKRLLGKTVPPLMVTDPPYAVEYRPEWRNEVLRSDGRAVGGRSTGEVLNDDRADWREAWALFPGDAAFVWHAGLHAATVQDSLKATGFEHFAHIVWAKDNFAISRGHYHWAHEPVWYAVRTGEGHPIWWPDDYEPDPISSVWQFPMKGEHDHKNVHGTQKPVAVMKACVEAHSRPGVAVYDPFVGSGTTIVTCELTGRSCYAVELSPAYCDVVVERWEMVSGETATKL